VDIGLFRLRSHGDVHPFALVLPSRSVILTRDELRCILWQFSQFHKDKVSPLTRNRSSVFTRGLTPIRRFTDLRLRFIRSPDLIPYFGTKLSMISSTRDGRFSGSRRVGVGDHFVRLGACSPTTWRTHRRPSRF